MALLITKRPDRLIGNKFSRWSALFNPYMFELTRKDYNISTTAIRPAYHATLPTCETDANPVTLPTQVSAGEQVYIKSGNYDGVYTVHSVNGNYITLDTPYIGFGTAGWVNLVEDLQNYKMYINIYNSDGVKIDTLYPKPNTTGLAKVDVSGVIKKLVKNIDTEEFTQINTKNSNISGSFYLGYGFTYKIGSLNITTIEVQDIYSYYWVSAAQQINGKAVSYGQNLADYTPFRFATNTATEAKFLTAFKRPTYFVGFPFSLSFIYSEGFKDEYLERHQQNNNVNGAPTSAESSDVLADSEQGYVNTLQLAAVETNTEKLDVWLQTGDEIEDGYTDDDYSEDGMMSEHAAPYSPPAG